MIIHTRAGAVVIINQNCWAEGAYLAVTAGSGAGAMLTLEELDQLRAELDRIAREIEETNKRKVA